MGMYTFEEIIKRWKIGDLTAEQAIGQLLLIMQEMNKRIGQMEKTVFERSTAKASGGSDK